MNILHRRCFWLAGSPSRYIFKAFYVIARSCVVSSFTTSTRRREFPIHLVIRLLELVLMNISRKKAAAEGALSWYTKQFVVARAARATYGVEVCRRYDRSQPDQLERAKQGKVTGSPEGAPVLPAFSIRLFARFVAIFPTPMNIYNRARRMRSCRMTRARDGRFIRRSPHFLPP